MKLSVVIPVYRVESTLDRCVESVLGQHVDAMEVILVDDGSPDLCPAMCDKWANRDSRVRVIHKENGGLSDARNTGIDIANGDYITFVDSDDWVADDTYLPILQNIGDSDIVEYPISCRLALDDHTYDNAEEYWLQEKAYTHTYAWNKLYRRSLFEDIRYPKGRIFEDVWTLPALLRKARRVTTTSKGCYHYTANPEGITATCGGEGLAQLLDAHLAGRMPVDDLYYMYLVNIQMDVWEQTGNAPILPVRHVDASTLSGRLKAKARLLNMIGINRLCRINKFIHRYKKPSP